MPFVTRQLKRIANKTNKAASIVRGERSPLALVCEYPKSGGTWFGKMLADAMQIPNPSPSVFPFDFRCVVHNHWRYDPRLRRVVYLTRDGRDVMVSYFFHRMRRLARGDSASVAMFGKRYERLFGPRYDHGDSVELLPRFIEEEFRRPRGARLNWRDHVRGWFPGGPRPGVVYASYEELRADTAKTVRRTVDMLSDRPVDQWFIQNAVDKFSMERQTGRRAGEEDRASFVRKGVVGDWRNHFTTEAAQVFDNLAGDVLIELGYEADRSWVGRCDPTTARQQEVFARGIPAAISDAASARLTAEEGNAKEPAA